MMKLSITVALMLAVGVITGCRTSQPDTRDPFVILQERARAATDAGGLAAVGMGTSLSQPMAIDKAKMRGRTEIAHMVETKVDSLKKDFAEEVGDIPSAEYNELFSAAAKNLAHQLLSGTGATDVRSRSDGKLTTAWALMVLNPKTLATAIEANANAQRHVYTRFRASQAFAELQSEIEKFEAFKRKDAGWLGK